MQMLGCYKGILPEKMNCKQIFQWRNSTSEPQIPVKFKDFK